MAQTLIYSGTSSGSNDLRSSRSVNVSGQSVSNAKSTGEIEVLAYCSCNGYTRSYKVKATVNGYSGYRSGTLFSSSDYTGKYISIKIAVPDSFDVNNISSFSVIDESDNAGLIFLKGITGYDHHVYAYYNVPTACRAPSLIAVAGVYNDAYLHEGNLTTLSWSGASAGDYNAITGYEIYKNGVYYDYVSTQYTYGTYYVYAPSAGNYDSYTIVTSGTISGLDSPESTARKLYGWGYVSAPTSIELANETPDAGANTTLRWSGAQGGGNNSIASYIVYRKAPSESTWTQLTTSTTTSATVTAPDTMGDQYEYCVSAVGTRGDTSAKSSSVTLTAKEYTTDPPGDVMLSVEKWTSGTVRLSWTVATCTSGSSISKYYIQQRIKNYGEDFGAWADLTNVTGTSYTFTPTLTAGQTAQYRVRALSNKSVYSSYAEASNELYRPFPPTAPASVTASPVIYNSGEVLISWPASTVTGGDVTRYYIEYSRNTGNGFGDWQSLANTGNDWYSYEPSSLRAGYILKYRVRAYSGDGLYGDYTESNEIHKASDPTAPTAFTASPSDYNTGDITLAWSGAADADGDIVAYVIQYNTSRNNSSWNGWEDLATIETEQTSGQYVNTPSGFERGTYRKYRICAVDSLELTSAYKESNVVYRGLAPSAPVITEPVAGIYETLTTLSWQASTPPDAYPIAGYEVQISTDNGASWSAAVQVTSGLSYDISAAFNALERGETMLIRVCAYNTAGIYGDYSVTGPIARNLLPIAPRILLPASGTGATDSPAPVILLAVDADPDGQRRTLQVKRGDADWESVAGYEGMPAEAFFCPFHASASGAYSFRVMDVLEACGPSAAAQITINAFTFTDATIKPGTTPIKAAHINELRAFVDSVRGYYGLEAYSWSDTVVAHTTSYRLFKGHIEELRTALLEALAVLNGTEAGRVQPVPAWTDLSDYAPRASAVMELRGLAQSI